MGQRTAYLVEDLETSVVAEDVEGGAVRLPEEAEPRCDEGTVGPVPALLLRDTAEQNALGRLTGLEILDLGSAILGLLSLLGGTLELVNLSQRLGELVARLLEELLDDDLDGTDGGVLGDVLVHVKTLLGGAALAKVNAEAEELDEDGLEGRERGGAEALRGEDLGDRREGREGLVDREQLVASLQGGEREQRRRRARSKGQRFCSLVTRVCE